MWAIRAEAPPGKSKLICSFCELRSMLLDTIFYKKFQATAGTGCCTLKVNGYSTRILRCRFCTFWNFCWQSVRIFSFPSKILQFILSLWQKILVGPLLEIFLAAPMLNWLQKYNNMNIKNWYMQTCIVIRPVARGAGGPGPPSSAKFWKFCQNDLFLEKFSPRVYVLSTFSKFAPPQLAPGTNIFILEFCPPPTRGSRYGPALVAVDRILLGFRIRV